MSYNEEVFTFFPLTLTLTITLLYVFLNFFKRLLCVTEDRGGRRLVYANKWTGIGWSLAQYSRRKLGFDNNISNNAYFVNIGGLLKRFIKMFCS